MSEANFDCIVRRVRFWKTILTLIVLATWLPATAHCRLEAIGMIPLDECCETTAGGEHHSDSACKNVEEISYKVECAAALPARPDTVSALIELCAIRCPTESVGIDLTQTDFLTLHLPQFFINTALPVRAPSLAS